MITGTGYSRNAHEDLLRPARDVLEAEAGDAVGVSRDYRVRTKPGMVSDDCGIWLQGCCESSHGVSFSSGPWPSKYLIKAKSDQLSDTLLSILATRSGELVDLMFGGHRPQANCLNGEHHTNGANKLRQVNGLNGSTTNPA